MDRVAQKCSLPVGHARPEPLPGRIADGGGQGPPPNAEKELQGREVEPDPACDDEVRSDADRDQDSLFPHQRCHGGNDTARNDPAGVCHRWA